ncbi:MAG: sigma-54-dependent Fis family transcriptional regulator [Ignavibacteria bacterium]|nr:sigma-54-dependent Fis family transcriptional regulator [Ignavibacteria bacterium]
MTKVLYHLLRKSDIIYALTNETIRYSQLMAVIGELKDKVEFEEIKCIVEMKEDFFAEIYEHLKLSSYCVRDNNVSKKLMNLFLELKSEIAKEATDYNKVLANDFLPTIRQEYSDKILIEKLVKLTENFYKKKIPQLKDFITIDNFRKSEDKITAILCEEMNSKSVYILNDLTGDIFNEFFEYRDPEIPKLNFILNANEFKITKPEDYKFKNNIFGTDRKVKLTINNYKLIKARMEKIKPFHEILTYDKKFIETLNYVKFLAQLDVTILILGDTGTGKELLAKGIHYESKRSSSPFKSVNCAAIPESLFESEMFGYEKGAFTGATVEKAGILESTNGGTLFLDEIGDLSPLNQAKILRVLQERKVSRVGSSKVINTDFRLICATNKDVNSKDFRSDLLYRIGTIKIELPPLKDRDKSDIELLVNHFADLIRLKYKDYFSIQYSQDAIKALSEYDWPGNARQLNSFVYETFLRTVYKNEPTFYNKPISDPQYPVYNTFKSRFFDSPNGGEDEPIFFEKPINIEKEFVLKYIESQKNKREKNVFANDNSIYTAIIDENITINDLPENINYKSLHKELKNSLLKKYLNAGKKQDEIAIAFRVTQQTISNWITNLNLTEF